MRWNHIASREWMDLKRRDNGLNQYREWENNIPAPNPNHWGSGTFYDDNIPPNPSPPPHPFVPPGNGVLMQDGYVTAGFNALNQPTAMWSFAYWGTSNWMVFGYDPLGRCVKRWVGTTPATYYYYDGWNLVQEGPTSAPAARTYVHGGRVDEIVASGTGGTWLHHHYDARGHCILLTDTGGNILEQYDYDAFGRPYFYDRFGASFTSSQGGNRFLFTGREWINDMRIYDYRHRMYQPELGRFLQPDPKHFAAGDYNLYRYCHNDPINKSDPFGLEFFPYNGPAIPVDQLYGGAGLGQSLVNPQVVVVSQPDGTSTLRLDVRVTGILVADRVKFHGKMETRSDKQKDVTFKEHEKGEHGKDWKGFHDEKHKEVPTTRFNDRDAAKEAAKGLTDKFRSDAFKANKEFEKHKPDERWKHIRDRELPR